MRQFSPFNNSRLDCVVTSRKKLKSSSPCYDTESDHRSRAWLRILTPDSRPVSPHVVTFSPPCHPELVAIARHYPIVILINVLTSDCILDTMFMKKRRYAELMAELHPQPPTPPTSEGGDSGSDHESDLGDIETSPAEEVTENKRARKTVSEDVTMLAELLVEFHNSASSALSPPTPPPSPCHEAREQEAPVRVSVIKHTNMREEEGQQEEQKEETAREEQESRQQEFTSELTKKTPPTESSYTQKQEIFVKCKNTDREGSETPSAVSATVAAATPSATPSSHNKQRPVILPKMTTGTNVFQSSSTVSPRPTTFLVGPAVATKQLFIVNQSPPPPLRKIGLPPPPAKSGDLKTPQPNREKSFVCSQPGCDKSYYKLSHLKAHFRVHTG